MKVKRLKMRSFRAIADLTLEFETDGPIVLIGDNGTGKTSILDCIRILLSYFVVRILFDSETREEFQQNPSQPRNITRNTGIRRFPPPPPGVNHPAYHLGIRQKDLFKECEFSQYDIKKGDQETANEIEIYLGYEQAQWSVHTMQKREKIETSSELSELEPVADIIRNGWQESSYFNIPLIAYYPVNRSVEDIPLINLNDNLFNFPQPEYDSTALEAYDEAISLSPVSFQSFFQWFKEREDVENEGLRDDTAHRDKQLNAVRQAIDSILEEEGFTNLRIRRNKPIAHMTVKKKGQELSIDQLSDGEKCLLAMVGDWARRLAIANPSLDNPLEGKGLLLIDEIDLHLHPKWQRHIIPALTKTFPNCQLIVTTHSPQVVSHVKPEGIYILKTTSEGTVAECPPYSFGRDSNRILEDVMGVPARPLEIKNRLKTLFKLIDEGNIAKARECQKELEQEIGVEEPEFAGAEALIRRKEILGR